MGFGFSSKPFFLFLSFLVLFTNLQLSPLVESANDYTTLVYKGCANQAFTDPAGVYSQALSALFQTLLSQSMKVKYFKTTTGTGQNTITGLFQCRGDLSNSDCYNCVSQLPTLVNKLCGQTIASRIQLYGCYMLYEVAGFSETSGMEILFKTCGATNVAGVGFQERRDTAFSILENGVVSSHGFYTTNYQSVYVLGQCEGDVGDSDCGDCIKSAVQRAQVECGSSTSGQIYLHKCFFSYGYYPNGVPGRSSSSSYSHASSSSSGTEQNTGKKVAIILGGAAGVGFLVILLMFAKGVMKKHDVLVHVKVPSHGIVGAADSDILDLAVFFSFKLNEQLAVTTTVWLHAECLSCTGKGLINRIKGKRCTALKNDNMVQNRHTTGSHIFAASPVKTRKSLNLSLNLLTGTKIGEMRSLEAVDFSVNKLSGGETSNRFENSFVQFRHGTRICYRLLECLWPFGD
ncbi:cysteine-rich repeat secretory protein 3-like [Durio zibethinus]|uniref:Cysteine-rich repeat secretory protein 3-like n=1 Tax=Durio zibethinus TaxID=66656 RepID=A0A6P5Z8F8_DURZI|nr:cysteine-rich repeat secretory protein 3-like [Durio zibethinus]